jgi:hypothetical protein
VNGHKRAYTVLRSIYGPPSGPIAEAVLGHVARAAEALSAVDGERHWQTWDRLTHATKHALHNAPMGIAAGTPGSDMRARGAGTLDGILGSPEIIRLLNAIPTPEAPPAFYKVQWDAICARWNCNDPACSKRHLVPCPTCSHACDTAQWNELACCVCTMESGGGGFAPCGPCTERLNNRRKTL